MKSLKRCCFSLICREIILGNHMCFMLQASASAISSSLELSSLLHLFSICYFQCICTKNNCFCSALDLSKIPTHTLRHTHTVTHLQIFTMDDSRDCRVDLFLVLFVAEHLQKLIFDLFFFLVFRDRRASIGPIGLRWHGFSPG